MTQKEVERINRNEEILRYIESSDFGGRVTEDIAEKFDLTNRQVGGIMTGLKREGSIRIYPKGLIMLPSRPCSAAAPMIITNSYYESLRPSA